MTAKASPRKLTFFIALTLLLVAGFSISTYYYILGRYTDQVVGMVETVMKDFSAEELESLINDEELLLALNEWQKSKDELAGLVDELDDINIQGTDITDGSNTDAGNSGGAGSEINTQDNPGSSSGNSNSSGSSNNDTGGAGDSSSLHNNEENRRSSNSTPAEDNSPPDNQVPDLPAELDQSLANKLTAQDTVFILQVYRKFSAAEREELKNLYREGGNRDLIKKKVTERLTPAEIERSIEMALRILG